MRSSQIMDTKYDTYGSTAIQSTPADIAMMKAVQRGNYLACDKALKDGASIETMLICGAVYGNAGMCETARKLGAREFNRMLRAGAEGGFEDITIMAREWGATDYNGMLVLGAQSGNAHICKRALELGATDKKHAVIRAAEQWNIAVLEILEARSLGSQVMFGAAKGNRYEIGFLEPRVCDLYSTSHVTLAGAAAGGHESLCRDVIRNAGREGMLVPDARDQYYNGMLFAATEYNQSAMCSLAREFGATDIERMLIIATERGFLPLCRMARDWGARDFNRMLLASIEASQPEACNLALNWKADNIDACIKKAIAMRSNEIMCVFIKQCGEKVREIATRDKELDIPSRVYVCRLFPQFADSALMFAFENVNIPLAHALVEKTKCSANAVIIEMASTIGRANIDFRMIELAHECGANDFETLIDALLDSGNALVTGECDYSTLFDLCVLVNSWGLISADKMMEIGKSVACARVCILAYELGSRNIDGMMRRAAKYGLNYDVCRLAREWGDIEFDWLLYYASNCGEEYCDDGTKQDELFENPRKQCEIARKWGATNFDLMMIGAMKFYNPELCNLALEWGASVESIGIGLKKLKKQLNRTIWGRGIKDIPRVLAFARDHGFADEV